MNTSILLALKDSITSRIAVDFLINLSLNRTDTYVTLLHVFRKPLYSEHFMGEDFAEKEHPRILAFLQSIKELMISKGFLAEKIDIDLTTESYETVSDGIIDHASKKKCDLVVIGRKRMSKAEEFVMGDISVKLIREIKGKGVLVVESK